MSEVAIKERPLLCSSPMILAILAGDKTQTRRVMNPQPPAWVHSFGVSAFTPAGHFSGRGNFPGSGPAEKFFRCPHGMVGDRLWVRETFAIPGPGVMHRDHDGSPIYAADYPPFCPTGFGPWKPSIFMPRWACRITLEITEVRVERVASITPADALAEGIAAYAEAHGFGKSGEANPVEAFAHLWDAINARRDGGRFAWAQSPWCWVVTFKRIGGES